MDMFIKILFLVVFFAVMIGVGIYCRKQATNVNSFVLGNRSVGPWLTAFAAMQDSSAGDSDLHLHG